MINSVNRAENWGSHSDHHNSMWQQYQLTHGYLLLLNNALHDITRPVHMTTNPMCHSSWIKICMPVPKVNSHCWLHIFITSWETFERLQCNELYIMAINLDKKTLLPWTWADQHSTATLSGGTTKAYITKLWSCKEHVSKSLLLNRNCTKVTRCKFSQKFHTYFKQTHE